VGKTTAARALAKALNCEQGPTAAPCGRCTSCLEIANGTSPDLIEIDGASNNSVDDVRELRETVRYAPQKGRSKIYLVDEVHMLSNAAFNALLKTLEEPPPHVVFIFATTEAAKIPETILSRVQRFDFKRIPVPGVVERLAEIAANEGVAIGEVGLRMIARAGEGSMRDAQSLLDKVISFGGSEISDAEVADTLGLVDRSLLFRMLGGLIDGTPDVCLEVIATVYAYGHEMSQLSEELLELVRHAAFVTMSKEARSHVDLPEEELARLDDLAARTDVDTLTRLFDALLDAHEQVSRAARPRIVLEMAMARLASIRPVVPIGQLVARLEGLERRLRQSGEASGGGGGGGGRGGRDVPHRAGPGRAHRTPPAPLGRPRARRARSAGLPADASDDDRWAAVAADLLELEPPAQALAGAIVRREDQRLIVTVEAGRALAAAKREAGHDGVVAVLRGCYGADVELVVEASLASRKGDVQADLEAAAMADPAVRRVLKILGGRLEDVRPDTPEA
jgi:DNA polymerase-3 subunit gamma/tau